MLGIKCLVQLILSDFIAATVERLIGEHILWFTIYTRAHELGEQYVDSLLKRHFDEEEILMLLKFLTIQYH